MLKATTLIKVLLAVIFIPVILLGFLIIYEYSSTLSIDIDKLPIAEGARGGNHEIRSADGTPYLWSHNLPYPTDTDDSNRKKQMLNGTWSMRFDPRNVGRKEKWYQIIETGEKWQTVTIPSNYNITEGPNTDYRGKAWFHLKFRPTFKTGAEQFARLCFRGVLMESIVWLNGKYIGSRNGGYTPFYFNITEHLLSGEDNILTVMTDNRLTASTLPPRSMKKYKTGWHSYGGIYRNVFLEAIPNHYIFKVQANTKLEKGNQHAILDILVLTHNRKSDNTFTLTGNLRDPNGRIISRDTRRGPLKPDRIMHHPLSIPIDGPILWTPENPLLYTVELTLTSDHGTDRITVRTGLRTVMVRGSKILLNGKQIFLKGIGKHEDHPELGAMQTDELIEQDLKLISEMGANYIRTAHYPHAARELIQARNRGLLLSEEIPLYQAGMGFVHWYRENQGSFLKMILDIPNFPDDKYGLRQLYNRKLLINAQRQLIEMIERDRNNPAIIIWSLGNECYTLNHRAGKIFAWLRSVARRFDNSRPVTMSEITYGIPFLDNQRTAPDYMDIVSLNAYYGWYIETKDDLGAYLDDVIEEYPDKPIIISEFGAGAAPGRLTVDGPWEKSFFPRNKTYSEEYQKELIAHYWKTVRKRDHIVGISPWIFSDFYCSWFSNNPVPDYNLKGVVSRYRKPKMAYYLLQSLYSEK